MLKLLFLPLFVVPAFCAAQFCAAPVDKNPDDFWGQRAHQDTLRAGMVYRQAAIDEYRSLLEKHEGEPEYLYLYGRVLKGTKTPEAIGLFNRALAKDARFAPAHLSLVEIYRAPNFRDAGKAREHLEAWMTLCPEGLEGFPFLERMESSEFLRSQVVRMRTLLAARKDKEAVGYYRTLWRLEFQNSPASGYGDVKDKIRGDLARLEAWAGAETLREGYQLIGDARGAKAPAAGAGNTAMKTYMEWQTAHPYPKPDAKGVFDQKAMRARNEALLEASAEWVKQYPDDPFAWAERTQALQMNRETTTDADVEAAAEGMKRTRKPGNGAMTPLFQVASLYLQRGMHLKTLPGMVEDGLKDLDAAPSAETMQSDFYPVSEMMSPAAQLARNRCHGYGLLADIYLRLDQPDRAIEALVGLRKVLDGKPVDSMNETVYWDKMGQIAERQGRKLDALVAYQTEIRTAGAMKGMTDAAAKKAKVLWTDLGGTEAGWSAFAGKVDLAAKSGVAVGVRKEWETKDTVLPALDIADLGGKTWHLTDLKGKTTLVNLWATWCGPCREELPQLQKLYDKWKDRKDFQIVTLNTDDNPGLIEPFMKENKYTFPVLPARAYVDVLVPSLSIPRNWIVNGDGRLKLEAVGFSNTGEDKWMDGIDVKMREVR